jgi:hypothetical protein
MSSNDAQILGTALWGLDMNPPDAQEIGLKLSIELERLGFAVVPRGLVPDVSLDEAETEVMQHLVLVMNGIRDWGLIANASELIAAIHVVQGFIIQHMLQRVGRGQWGEWYNVRGTP